MFDQLRCPHGSRAVGVGALFGLQAIVAIATAAIVQADPAPAALEGAWHHATTVEAQMIAPQEALAPTAQPALPGRWSLGGPLQAPAPHEVAPVTAAGITWHAPSACVPVALRKILAGVVAHFGPIAVTSTCRPTPLNKAVGGADHSYHLTGEAIDFRVPATAVPDAVYAHLAQTAGVGGLKHYGDGLFHIDNGPRRTW